MEAPPAGDAECSADPGSVVRVRRSVLIFTTLVAAWLSMQLIHELGHVLGAYGTGGSVERVAFHPLELSRTDLAQNPHPLAVAWAGPVLGALIPLLVWAFTVVAHPPLSFLTRFFAAFCLVANGAYIGAGLFGGFGDSTTMLTHGTPAWAFAVFACAAVPLGLFLWHHQGGDFGLG